MTGSRASWPEGWARLVAAIGLGLILLVSLVGAAQAKTNAGMTGAPLVVYIPTGLPGMHEMVNGEPQGFYPDLIRALGRQSGITLELRTDDWPGPLEAVREGRGQVLGPIMGQPSAFKDLVHTEPIMRAEWARYVLRGNARSPAGVGYQGVRFAALNGVATRWLLRDHPKAILIEVETIEEGFQAVLQGKVDSLLAADSDRGSGHRADRAHDTGTDAGRGAPRGRVECRYSESAGAR